MVKVKTKLSMTTAEMERVVREFVYDQFSIRQVAKLLVVNEDEKFPFQSGAQMVYKAIEEHSPDLLRMLDRFTPHPACRFSLIRDTLHNMNERASNPFSHQADESNSAQKVSKSAATPVFSAP